MKRFSLFNGGHRQAAMYKTAAGEHIGIASIIGKANLFARGLRYAFIQAQSNIEPEKHELQQDYFDWDNFPARNIGKRGNILYRF
ncbi:MAG TPA: hypothetical protein HA254_05765 [Candidatus Diapherotrites archaeon]|uniref:Uncharacterized protein n=1 Tax=Candidatus Iainarchaeum sp. TaxID=3101447 RepID=A0A7J4IX65_9ARCH|nr:hypothetical protein [Candidatus Diapherotrites archaeon]